MVILLRFLGALLLLTSTATRADVIITEISDKGTSNACDGNDWIEIYNSGELELDLGLEGYVLHDSKGVDSDDTFSFPGNAMIQPQEYKLLCTEQKIAFDDGTSAIDPMSPQFGISGADTIYLTRIRRANPNATNEEPGFIVNSARNGDTYEIVSTVALPNTDDAFDVTYALVDFASGKFNYTSTPTPGAANVISKVLSQEERNAKFKEQLKAQNDQGTIFFNMDDRGLPVPNGMDHVLDLNFTMESGDYSYLVMNKTFEQYRPFTSAVLTTTDGQELLSLSKPGRIRAKGQSSLYLASCMGAPAFPFQVEMGGNETLFGAERIYLRHHIGDYSFMRDYAYNRMLARFGLPYLRARKVRVSINGNLHGFYTLMEAPDQDYVFHRSFPDFNPQAYALFKIKSFAYDCGSYTNEEIEVASARLHETATPPYAFQRGEHKEVLEELGLFQSETCIENYDKDLWKRDYYDVILAWLRYDKDCADMLLGEGLVEQDLGTKGFKKEIREWISMDYSDEVLCTENCANSNLAERVDQENWLKAFAFYAVTANSDTPLVNGNNFYLANGGTGGWKLVPYDFNLPNVVYCHDDVCNERLVHWSIARPTCTSLEENNLVGPLLTDEKLHAQYLEYVREFVETVYGNQSFVDELQEHAAAQESYVKDDFWSFFGVFYSNELTPESAKWKEEVPNFPLLPTMKARAEDVRAQLEAIDSGTFPRGPFVGVHGDNEPWEPCADWRLTEPNRTSCAEECMYYGCSMPDWTVESYCDEETGKCYHGNYDEQCRGVFDGFKYTGMEDVDGRETFCRFTKGVPVKTSECPAPGEIQPPVLESSAGTETRGKWFWSSLLAAVSALVLLVQ